MEIKAKIGLNPCGAYDGTREYSFLDTTEASSGTYLSLKDNNKGHEVTDTSWWECIIYLTGVNNATATANTAASNADNKAALADASSQKADTSAANADTATANANTATQTANTAASNADAATSKANTATKDANDAANKADTATANANTAATAANNAATNANNAATRVTNAITDISAEKKAATDAATAANNITQTAITAENARVEAENSRVSAETSRVSAESGRASSESTRQSNENSRVSAETSRSDAESSRVNAEKSRVSSESSRSEAESSRQTTESERQTNETARKANETSRVSAESKRVTAETNRASNESSRVTAETDRQNAESTRESNTSAAISNLDTSAANADTATANANTAAQTANTAASEATTAAANANAATANCETATSKANTATDKANTAATAATTAASEATTAAANANAAASSVENLSALYAYGVEWDTTVSSPNGTRIGNATLHHTLPVQNMMKGVLLGDDGTENQILNDATWIGQPLDGSKGQVMVKIPNYWFRCETDGTKFRFWESDHQLAGFTQFFDNKINYVYCSAYEAGLDRTNMALVSIVNSSTQYRGGNNTADWDGTYRSLLNMPATNISRTNFRTYARKRNSSANTCWNEYIYTIHVMISWLFFTEYATLNSQKDYNASLDSNGYKQGGLGAGVSNMPNWGTYNSYCPIIPNGVTDSLGNGSGVVTYNVIASDGTTTYYAAPVPRYRGIQNPFGHVWKWSDGINIKEDGTTRTAYVTTHPSKFSDTAYDGYENRGTISHSEGWTTKMLLGYFGDLLPLVVGGSSSTFWCDYYWLNTSPNLYGALLGGNANAGAADGFGCVITSIVTSTADTSIGSRLCFVPSV